MSDRSKRFSGSEKHLTHSREDEGKEMSIIATPNAVIYPLTMMIASVDTIIALCES
jgi:hypothetical protein